MNRAAEYSILSHWQDFEQFCRDLFAAEWNDPETKRFGGLGEDQGGIDILGRRAGNWQAVQCKKKAVSPPQKLSQADVRNIVKVARKCPTSFETLIIATTVNPDTKIDAFAVKLSGQEKFRVEVYGWRRLCELLDKHPAVRRAWYPTPAEEGEAADQVSGAEVPDSKERKPQGVHEVGEPTEENEADISPSAAERRAALIADLKVLLESQPRLAAEAISRRREAWADALERSGPSGLVDILVEATDVADVLFEMEKAHADLLGREEPHRRAAHTIEQIVWHLAPLLVHQGFLQSLPKSMRAVCIQLPVATYTIAELALAAFDGRPSRFKQRESDDPEGVGRIPVAGEEGFDYDGGNMLCAYGEHFEEQYLTPGFRRALARKRRVLEEGEELAREDVFKSVNKIFEYEIKGEQRPMRHYLLYDDLFAEANPSFLEDFGQRMSALHLVEMTGFDIDHEQDLYLPLTTILQRCAQSGKEKGKP